MWRDWSALFMALVGGSETDDTLAWPKHGHWPGAQWQRWWPCIMVVVVDGSERKDGTVTMCDAHDVSTAVAQFGNSRVHIIN